MNMNNSPLGPGLQKVFTQGMFQAYNTVLSKKLGIGVRLDYFLVYRHGDV